MRVQRHAGKTGSAVLYTIVLSPILMLCLALSLEAGALQLQKARLRSAADVATTTASAVVSATAGASVQMNSATADAEARRSLLDNLGPLESHFYGTTAADVAERAEVVTVLVTPAPDPFNAGRTLIRPTLLVRFQVPVSSGLLAAAGLSPSIPLTIVSSADLRVGGADAP